MDKILSEEQALKLKEMKAERRATHKKSNARKHTNKECHKGSKEGVKGDCKMKGKKTDSKPAER